MRVYWQAVPFGDVNCARFTWTHQALLAADGSVYGHSHQANFGELSFACFGQSDCKSKMDAIEAAFYTPYGNLLVKDDLGFNTTNCIASSGTLQGVRPMTLTWDDRPGAQFTTWRSYSCSFAWETRLSGLPGGFLLEFTETVTVTGGTPLKIVREPINVAVSAADEFTVLPKQKYTVSQRGRAVGLTAYPAAALPLYTNPSRTANSTTTPEKIGAGNQKFPCEWDYFWEFGALASLPLASVWP